MSIDNLHSAIKDAQHSRKQGDGHSGPTSRLTDKQLTILGVGRTLPIECDAPTHETPVLMFKCGCNAGLTRRKYSRKPCRACGEMVVRAERPFAERGNRDRVTCPALFCAGDSEAQGFSRTIAVRYLSKRMVYAPRSNAKGREDAPAMVHARKVSSARHAMPFFLASDIEDLVNDAYLIWSTELTRTGDRLKDSCNAARRAHTRLQRLRFKNGKAMDAAAYNAALTENRQRSSRNVTWDDTTEAMLAVIRQEGTADQTILAAALGISQQAVSKRLAKLRERILREESRR